MVSLRGRHRSRQIRTRPCRLRRRGRRPRMSRSRTRRASRRVHRRRLGRPAQQSPCCGACRLDISRRSGQRGVMGPIARAAVVALVALSPGAAGQAVAGRSPDGWSAAARLGAVPGGRYVAHLRPRNGVEIHLRFTLATTAGSSPSLPRRPSMSSAPGTPEPPTTSISATSAKTSDRFRFDTGAGSATGRMATGSRGASSIVGSWPLAWSASRGWKEGVRVSRRGFARA